MSKKRNKTAEFIVAWDGLKLGRVAAGVAGFAVMALCLWPGAPKTTAAEAILRYGWTSLGAFVATYFAVTWTLRIVLSEFVVEHERPGESETVDVEPQEQPVASTTG